MLRKIKSRRLSLEHLESRMLLAADIVLSEPVVYPAGDAPAGVRAGDVNLDGALDLVVPNYSCCGQPAMLLGNGDGTFGAPIRVRFSGILADFDNDGELDVLQEIVSGVRVMLNEGIDTQGNGWKGFGSPRDFQLVEGSLPQGPVGIGDFDADDDLDIAVADGKRISVLLNNGVVDDQWQGFGEAVFYHAGDFPDRVVPGDLDGDGDLDLVVGNYRGGDVSVFLGNGDGTFANSSNFLVGRRTGSVKLGDLDGDGDLDIAAAVFKSKEVAVLMGNGDGTFEQRIQYQNATQVESISAGDMDEDGDLDIVVASYGLRPGEIRLMVNNGDGTFFLADDNSPTGPGKAQNEPTLIDLDGDGDLDLVVATAFGGTPQPLSCAGCGVNVFLNETVGLADGPLPGDADMNGVFDQLDIVLVLQAAKYLTGQPASFAEGDWNGDGVFDQLDVIAALATNSYL